VLLVDDVVSLVSFPRCDASWLKVPLSRCWSVAVDVGDGGGASSADFASVVAGARVQKSRTEIENVGSKTRVERARAGGFLTFFSSRIRGCGAVPGLID
jgi:hypothetical protein